MILDDRDFALKVLQAEAALATAKSNLGVAQATTTASKSNIISTKSGISTVDAQIEAAKINVWRTTQDYNRYNNLIKDHSITQQQFEQADAAKQSAERQLQVLISQKNQVTEQTNAVASQSNATSSQISVAGAVIKQREVEVAEAKLNLSYTAVIAQESGLVSKINVQDGQLVQMGQALFSIVLSNETWVIANFKETQLEKMHIGQKVTVHADVFPDHSFEATLTSFSPATGSRFALLPPDNASGNFVKVVQRLPVKIEFNTLSDTLVKQLKPGMNVAVDVHLN
ncbi:MAG: HlyD family secretion protein [Ferruginibacter sp.]